MNEVTLYDGEGRKVDLRILKEVKEQAGPTLAGVRNIYSLLYPSSSLTPTKLTSILRQADFGDPYLYLEMAEEMEEKDPHYLAVMNKRKGAVSSLDITIKPASQDKADKFIADFLTETLLDEAGGFNLTDSTYDMLDAVGKGFSATEIIWDTEKRVNGRLWWVPERLEWRDPRWFMFDWISGREMLVRTLRPVGQTLDMTMQITDGRKSGEGHFQKTWIWNEEAKRIGIQPLTEPLAPFKFITHFGRAKSGLPIRAGLARCLAWAFLWKMWATKDWATFMERFGMPLRLGKYPPGATEEDKRLLLAAVTGIGADMAGVVPSTMTVEFEAAQGTDSNSNMFQSYHQYFEDLQSKAVLGGTLSTQMRGSSGSRAAAEVHKDVEDQIVLTDARRLQSSINRDLVRAIVDLNFGPQKKYPSALVGLPDDEDMAKFMEVTTGFARAGMRIPVKPLYEKLKLPEPVGDEECLTPPETVSALDPESVGRANSQPRGEPKAAPGGSGEGGGSQFHPASEGDLPPTQFRPSSQRSTDAILDDDEVGRPERSRDKQNENRTGSHAQRPSRSSASRPHARMAHPADMIEDFADRQREDAWREVMPGLIEPIRLAIANASDYKDLEARLDRIVGEMDATKFQKQAAEAFFASMIAGIVSSPAA